MTSWGRTPTRPAGGWNRRVPPGVPRCSCRTRLFYWAHLDRRAGQPCCQRPCCSAPRSALTVTREGLRALRDEVGDGPCPRCGQPIARHRRNFECVDHRTRTRRAYRVRYGR